MLESLNISRMAGALADHAAARMGLIARNVAQSDTPGYKAVDLESFASVYGAGATAMRATRPGHLGAQGMTLQPILQRDGNAMAPNGNTVSVSHEMVKSVEVRKNHNMALAVYRSTSEIIRLSLGRR